MADFNDVINQLKENNVKEAKRDSRYNKLSEERDISTKNAIEEVSANISNIPTTPPPKPEEPEPDPPNPEDIKQTTFLGKLVNRLTGNKGAEEEKAKKEAAADKKQFSILSKIAGGIGGILGNVKDKAKKVGKGLFDVLKGLAIGGAFFAIAEFLKSPMFTKVVDYITNTVMPAVNKFYDETIKPMFDSVIDFFMNDAFPAIKKFVNETLLPLLKDVYDNVIKPMFDGLKAFAVNSLFPAVKDIFAKFGETYDKIKPSLDSLMKFLKETTLPALFEGLKKQMVIVKDIFMKIADFIGNVITGDFSKAFDNLGDIGKLIVKAIDNAISTVLKMVGLDFEGNVSDVIGRFFDGIFKSIKDAVNGVLNSIEDLIRAVPGIGDTVADTIFGEQTAEEIALKEEKKRQAEIAEKEEERQQRALELYAQRKRIDDKIAEEQARITRSESGMDEYFGSERGGIRTSKTRIDRLNFERERLQKQLVANMPTANDNEQRTNQMMQDQAKMQQGQRSSVAVVTDNSKSSISNSSSVKSVSTFAGNPDLAIRMATQTN